MESIIYEKLEKLPKYEVIWILEVEKYILQNLSSKDLHIGSIAKNLCLSERQFYRRIKKIIGLTPNNLIRLLRLEKAKMYLEDGEYATISEVSYAVGYQSPDYFSVIFYKYFGRQAREFFRKSYT